MDIFFTNRDELIKVSLDDIMYIKADGNYVIICFKSGRTSSILSSLHGMKQLLDKTAPETFVLTGRSHIVNVNYVSQIHAVHKTIVVADDNTKVHVTLRVSKESVAHLMEIMNKRTGKTIDSFETRNGNMKAWGLSQNIDNSP